MPYVPFKYKPFALLPNAARLSPEELGQSKLAHYLPCRMFTAEVEALTDDEKKLATSFQGGKSFILVSAMEMHDNTGIAFRLMPNGDIYWWKFAHCWHEHQTSKNIGRCLNRYTCTDCGYSHDIDSSD